MGRRAGAQNGSAETKAVWRVDAPAGLQVGKIDRSRGRLLGNGRQEEAGSPAGPRLNAWEAPGWPL